MKTHKAPRASNPYNVSREELARRKRYQEQENKNKIVFLERRVAKLEEQVKILLDKETNL